MRAPTNSVKLSIIMAGRDDDYGNHAHDGIRDLAFTPIPYINRLANTIEKFDDGFRRIGIDAEIIIVDWGPSKILFENPTINEICQDRNVRFVIVKKNMVRSMKLNPEGFDEFFAKNVGIRSAVGGYILLTNSDAWPDERLFQEVSGFLTSNLSTFYGRPHSRIDLDPNQEPTGEGLTFHDQNLDGILGTPAAGDFVLTKRENIMLVGGYNETGKRKFTRTRQAGLDGQLLMNLYLQGILPRELQGSILTFDHNKILRHDYGVPQKSYINKANWGLSDKPREYLSKNVIVITGRELRQDLHSKINLVRRKYLTAKSILGKWSKSKIIRIRNTDTGIQND